MNAVNPPGPPPKLHCTQVECNEVNLALFYAMRDHGKTHSTTRINPQKHRLYFLRDNSRQLVGGMLVNVLEAGEEALLPFEKREIFNTWERFLPSTPLQQFKRAQITSLTVPENVGLSAARIGSRTMLEMALMQLHAEGTDVCLIAPAYSTPQHPSANLDYFLGTMRNLHEGTSIAKAQAVFMGPVNQLSAGTPRDANTRALFAVPFNKDLAAEMLERSVFEPVPQWIDDKRVDIPRGHDPMPERKKEVPTVRWSLKPGVQGYDTRLNRPAAVLFDWDQVFIDHIRSYALSCNHVFHKLKMEYMGRYDVEPAQDRMRILNPETDVRDFIRDCYRDLDPAIREEVIAKAIHEFTHPDGHYMQNFSTAATPLIGAANTLAMLKKQGIPYAIVSNGQEWKIRKYIEHMFKDHQELFENVPIVALSGLIKKPAETGFREAVELLKKQTGKDIPIDKNIWFIGDTMSTDIEGALRIGMHPILLGGRDINQLEGLRQKGYGLHPNHDYVRVTRLLPPRTPEEKAHAIDHYMVGFAVNHEQLQHMLTSAIKHDAVRSAHKTGK